MICKRNTVRMKFLKQFWKNTKQELSEFNLDGYCMFSNNLEDNSRSILIYVSKDVKCTQIFLDIGFNECVILDGVVY